MIADSSQQVFSNEMREKIKEHLYVLEKEGIRLDEDEIIAIEENEMVFYGFPPFLTLTMKNGEKMLFTYFPSEGTSYCECEESSQNFKKEHNCCGILCDFEVPAIKILKKEKEDLHIFRGLQKELWELS